MGAKVLNPSSIKAKIGYALDSSGINRVVVGAPAANRITAKIKGVAAHAGLSPEKGISAIHLAARAIARLKLGRLDPESTANIGLIEGGTATNIIPESVVVHGEVRSHTLSKLKEHIQNIQDVFQDEVDNWTDPDFQQLRHSVRHPLHRHGQGAFHPGDHQTFRHGINSQVSHGYLDLIRVSREHFSLQ
jgi:tripeptide aminopeptidase